MNKILSFKLWGDYGHFKKFYTTTSPLTYEIPSPPTVLGIISAIIGYDKNEYLNIFQDETQYNIALKLNKPVNKVRWSQNLINTAVGSKKNNFWKIYGRTQIKIEFLKNPSYTIYFYHSDNSIYDKLKSNLRNHNSYYSVCLGLSELLANFEYVNEVEIEKKHIDDDDFIALDSILPVEALNDNSSIQFDKELELFKTMYPIKMEPDRSVSKRKDLIIERNCKKINCKLNEYYRTSDGEIIVFI